MTFYDASEPDTGSPCDSGVSSDSQSQGDIRDTEDRALHEFLAQVAYQMLSSATVSVGYSELLRRHLDRVIARASEDAEVRHALDRCLAMLDQLTRSNERLMRLNRNLSDAIHAYEGAWLPHTSVCDLGEIVRQAIERAESAGFECQLHVAMLSDTLVDVVADQWRVVNLLSDVLIELSMFGGSVTVHVAREDRQARVWVHTDRARDLRRILYRQLYLAQAVMKNPQGEVGIYSMGDEGDIFWLTLPLASDA